METQFLEPVMEMKIGWRNKGVQENGGKTAASDYPSKNTFGLSYDSCIIMLSTGKITI